MGESSKVTAERHRVICNPNTMEKSKENTKNLSQKLKELETGPARVRPQRRMIKNEFSKYISLLMISN